MKNELLENIINVVNKECNFVKLQVLEDTVPYVEEDDDGRLKSSSAVVVNITFTRQHSKFRRGREVLLFEPAIVKAIKRLNRGKKQKERIKSNFISYSQAADIIWLASDKNINIEKCNVG